MTLQESMRELAGDRQAQLYSSVAEVLAVDRQRRTVDVRPINGDADVLDVRLQALPGGATGMVIYPTVGSDVVITWLNPTTAYVAIMAEIDKASLSNATVSAADLIGELLGILKTFQLATNMGPTVQVMPQVVAQIDLLQTKINQLLE